MVRIRFDGTNSPDKHYLHRHPRRFAGRLGRIAFGPDGKLYVATGEPATPFWRRTSRRWAARFSGSIPTVRPFGQSRPGIAGVVLRPSEYPRAGMGFGGPAMGDGVRRGPGGRAHSIQPGGNYGWPMAEGVLTGRADQPGDRVADRRRVAVRAGLLRWLAVVACLRGSGSIRYRSAARRSGRPAAAFVGEYGRLRTVVAAPNGSLWFSTSNRNGRGSPRGGDDRILQFRP